MSDLIDRVDRLVAQDPAALSVVQVLVGEEPVDPASLARSARTVNDARRRVALEEFLDGALRTRDVVAALPGVTSRQAVARMHRDGRLMGRRVGRDTYFPAWQFGPEGPREDLPRLLAVLRGYVGDDVMAADRVLRLEREELDGLSIDAALQDRRRAQDAWRLLGALGGPR